MLPLVTAIPIYIFVFKYTLVVMRPYDGPDHRAGFLDLLFLAIMFCVVTITLLPGFAFLWQSGAVPKFSRAMTIVFTIMLLPAIYLSTMVYAFYFPN